ncbi:hypothetical protein AYO38_09260 [bacterium SCGC AG-212-C10]|nr:hypothetical protein AYO38_09260 [bacterium SCGC AG-212-C10]
MANNKSAIKRWHQSLKRRDRNRARRSFARTAVRNVREVVPAGDSAATHVALSAAFSALDRAAKKGAIHKRKADRQKRRLAALASKS